MGSLGERAIAQSLADCEPPRSGEYLLLVLNEDEQTPAQLRQTLPPNTTSTVCNYLGREVTRVSGFDDPSVAASWAQYLTDIGGLQAFVARPPDQGATAIAVDPPISAPPAAPVSTNPVTPTPAPTVTAPPPPEATTMPAPATPPATTAAAPTLPAIAPGTYDPQPLGEGYAVLVNYFSTPGIAGEVQQLLSRQVGLVAYNENPYLLAIYTSDPEVASSVFRTLSDRNFSAVIVDSRRTVLLTPVVALP